MPPLLDAISGRFDKTATLKDLGQHHSGPLSCSDADDVFEVIKEQSVESIRIWFTDILGFLKSYSLTPSQVQRAFDGGMGFDGSSITGYQRINDSDMIAVPDPRTAQILPFKIGNKICLRMFADIRNTDGSIYHGDPRQILKNNLDKLPPGLRTMNVGPEAEFYYFRSPNSTEVIDNAGYFSINPVDNGDEIREVTVTALESMGIAVEYSHHEVGPSQHEIDLKFTDALTMADQIITHKWLVKEIARKFGVHATFMPKPLADQNGSGMHVHLSLADDDGNNLFYADSAQYHLSDIARQFMAGILSHANEMCLVTNQWHNSYKRLVPGFEAPVYVAWAEKNRSAMIRVPASKSKSSTRFEMRFPDAACNPYLAFAAIAAAGVNGLYSKVPLPNPVSTNLYQTTHAERSKLGVRSLPSSLENAVAAATASGPPAGFLPTVLGPMFDKLLAVKTDEIAKYRTLVTKEELEQYTVL